MRAIIEGALFVVHTPLKKKVGRSLEHGRACAVLCCFACLDYSALMPRTLPRSLPRPDAIRVVQHHQAEDLLGAKENLGYPLACQPHSCVSRLWWAEGW